MRRYLTALPVLPVLPARPVLSALALLTLAGCSPSSAGDEGREPAVGDVVSAPAPTCAEVFKDGQPITAAAARTTRCTNQGQPWVVDTLACTDGRTLLHPVTGWGYEGEAFHAVTTSDGGVPDDVVRACQPD